MPSPPLLGQLLAAAGDAPDLPEQLGQRRPGRVRHPHVVRVALREAARAKPLAPFHVAAGHQRGVEAPDAIDGRAGREEVRGRGESPADEALLREGEHAVVELRRRRLRRVAAGGGRFCRRSCRPRQSRPTAAAPRSIQSGAGRQSASVKPTSVPRDASIAAVARRIRAGSAPRAPIARTGTAPSGSPIGSRELLSTTMTSKRCRAGLPFERAQALEELRALVVDRMMIETSGRSSADTTCQRRSAAARSRRRPGISFPPGPSPRRAPGHRSARRGSSGAAGPTANAPRASGATPSSEASRAPTSRGASRRRLSSAGCGAGGAVLRAAARTPRAAIATGPRGQTPGSRLRWFTEPACRR